LLKYTRKKIEVPEFIKGLIFDCDGTLVDSMPLHMMAWEYAIKKAGTVWDYNFFNQKSGMPSEGIVDLYNKHYGSSLESDVIAQTKQEYFKSHSTEFKPIEQVVEVVVRYKNILPMAVASGSIKENVHLQLEALGIKDYFKAIITADDDIKPKPSPDIFLEAAVRLGVSPNLCQVFEDGDLGLQAAEEAGMLATDVRPFL
jgi:HAD superfamily hydrolase (TIGR01509 family)